MDPNYSVSGNLGRWCLVCIIGAVFPALASAENKSSIVSGIFPNLWNDPLRWTSSGEPNAGDNIFIGPAIIETGLPEASLPIFYVSSRPDDTILGTLTINAPALQTGFQTAFLGPYSLPIILPDFASFFPRGIHQAGGTLRTTNEIIGTNQYGYFLQTGGLHTVEEDSTLGRDAGGMGAYLIDAPVDGLYRVRRDFLVGNSGTGFFQQLLGNLIVQRDLWFGKSAGGLGVAFSSGPIDVWRDVIIGGAGLGQVTVGDDFKVGGSLYIGRDTGGIGQFVAGLNSRVKVTGDVHIGSAVGAEGSWEILTGANTATVTGDVQVGGDGSGAIEMHPATVLNIGQHLLIGSGGTGTFSTNYGNTISVGGNVWLGSESGSDGDLSLLTSSLTVTGEGRIGGAGSGTIGMANSSLSLGQDLIVAFGADSSGRLELLHGSQLTVGGITTIGRAGTANLIIGGTGTGNTGTAHFEDNINIGTQSNGVGSGRLTLNQGTVEVNGFTQVGHAGIGTWEQTGGEAVFNSTFSLGHDFTGSGTLDLSGGAMQGTNLLLLHYGVSAQVSGGSMRFTNVQQLGGSLTFAEGQTLEIGPDLPADHSFDSFRLDGGTTTVPVLVLAGGVLEQFGGSLVTQEMQLNAGTVRGELHNTGVLTVAPGVNFEGTLNTFSDFDITGEFSPQGGLILSGGYTSIESDGIYLGGPVEVRDGGNLEIRTGSTFRPEWDLTVTGGRLDVSGEGITFEPSELIITGGMTTFTVSAVNALDLTRTTLRFGSESPAGSDLIIGYSLVPNVLPGGRTMYWSGSIKDSDGSGASRLYGDWTISEHSFLQIQGAGSKKLMHEMTNYGGVNWSDGDVLGSSSRFTNHGQMVVSASGNYWNPDLINHGTIYVDNAGGAHFNELANHGLIRVTPIVSYVSGGMYVLGPYSGAGTINGHENSNVFFEGGGVIGGSIQDVRVYFTGTNLTQYEVANAATALGTASYVRLENATLNLQHPGGGPMVFNNDFELRSGAIEVEGATALNFAGNVKLGAPGSNATAPVLPFGVPVTFLLGSSVEIQGLDANITIASGASGLFGGASGLSSARSRNTGIITNEGILDVQAAGSLSQLFDPLAEMSYQQANAKEIVGGGQIINAETGALTVDFGLVSGSNHLVAGGTARAAGKISQDLVNMGEAVIRGVAHPDIRLAWWDGLIENAGDLLFGRGWMEVNQLRQIYGTSEMGNISLRTTQGLSVEGGTLATNGTFLQSNVSVTDAGRVTVGPNGLLVYGTFADAPTSTVHLQGRFASTSSFLTNFNGTLILDGPGAGIYAANAVFPSNVSGAPSIAASFGTHLTPTLTTVPLGATLNIRNGYNISDNTNWTTHGTFLVGSGSTLNRNGGTLGGNGEIRVLSGGSLVLGGGGNWSGPAGPIIIEWGGTLALDPHSNANNRFYGRTVTNHGTANHNAAFIGMNPDTLFTNHGTWNDYTGGNTFGSFDGQPAGGLFENFGTFNKNATGSLEFSSGSGGPAFTNHGMLNINAGTFSIHRTSTFTGTSVVNIVSGATLLLRDGTNIFNDGARFLGTGALSLGDAGQHHLNGTIHADNASFWGGTLHGTARTR